MKSKQSQHSSGAALTEEDYYISADGLTVFTRKYHLRRGYCCKSGCIHCPYGFKKRK